MRKIIGWLGVAIAIAVIIAAFVAYVVYRTDPATHVMYDGFGRPLSETPFLVRWIFGHERLWAGWLWFIGDMVIVWGGSWLGVGLADWGFRGAGTLTWHRFFHSPGDAVLVRHRRELVQLLLVFGGRCPDAKQLFVLRKHFQAFQDVPPTELRDKLTASAEHKLGEYDCGIAARIQRALAEAALPIVPRTIQEETLTAFDRKLNKAVVMLDHRTTTALIQQMLSDGVPVIDEKTPA